MFLSLTWVDCKTVEVQGEVGFDRLQPLIDLHSQDIKGITDVLQLSFRELNNKAMRHPKEAIAHGVGGGGGELDRRSVSWRAGHR